MIREHASGDLVDLGCGHAPYRGMYADRVHSIVTVDWEGTLHRAAVDVTCDLNRGIALPDASADTILCTDILEHIFEPRVLWSEMSRVLRPNGKALVGVPFYYWIHEQPHDYHRYTQFALKRYAEEAGFKVVSLQAAGGLSCVVGDLLCKAAPRRLKGVADRAVRLFARPSAKETAFPLAYLLVAQRR